MRATTSMMAAAKKKRNILRDPDEGEVMPVDWDGRLRRLQVKTILFGGPHDYGDEMTVPVSVFTKHEACLYFEDGVPIAAQKVKDSELDQFMSLVSHQDARILPVTRGRSGKRYNSWTALSEQCAEAELEDWPLSGTRTTSWCVDYLVRMGQTIESHHEDVGRRCKFERNSRGCFGVGRPQTS